eukprot:TRINITY_DN23729_c0_g1_i1.p1 TRINITY_DN23729_c0_g1~~TRINITY_DN23729_c0_g1_i1.p1  ORF type:complete len:843 (-),score=74.25 TRINITY_DN23729_c0_g1_i1:275-2803(-)
MRDHDGAGDASSDNEEVDISALRAHIRAVRTHLECQLEGFGELDLSLSDLDNLEGRCISCGIPVAVLKALDDAMAAAEDDADDTNCHTTLTCEVSTADDVSPEALAHRQAEVRSCMGDYLALFRFFEEAKGQYDEALLEDPSCLWANLGLAKVLASRIFNHDHSINDTALTDTLEAAFACTHALVKHSDQIEDTGQLRGSMFETDVCHCVHLLDNITDLCLNRSDLGSRCVEGVLNFLHYAASLLQTSAASAIEALARKCLKPPRWLLQPLDSVDDGIGAFPAYIRALLVNSQTFCHSGLERHLRIWRINLSRRLKQRLAEMVCNSAEQHHATIDDMNAAAALACHCHFVGYCIPLLCYEEETRIVMEAKSKADPEHVHAIAWCIIAMYELPEMRLSVSDLHGWTMVQSNEASRDACALAVLHDRIVRLPTEDVESAKSLLPLKQDYMLPHTPCRQFYDSTVYPPWHDAVECAGVSPVSVDDRLRRLYPWRRHAATSSDVAACGQSSRSSILIAGCGSGHQIAVELRTYADCDVVALDCSARTVAYAKRKLRAVLSDSDFQRLHFMVGDILQVGDADSALAHRYFDLVICCGVLHHLVRPEQGLRALVSRLKPAGVLQLATYSRINIDTWHGACQRFLHESPSTRCLYDGHARLLRLPTAAEIRSLREEILSLPSGNDIRDLFLHFREFYTRAGILDLLFHPLETAFTLTNLQESLLRPAGLRVLGLTFFDANADLAARRCYRARFGGVENTRVHDEGGTMKKDGGVEDDPHMVDLARWHALEEENPDLFGRMHCLFLERACDAETKPSTQSARRTPKRPAQDLQELEPGTDLPQHTRPRCE